MVIYRSLSPISVSSGEEYTVAVYLNGSGGIRMMNWNGPKTYGNILVNYAVFKSSYNSDTYPNTGWQNETYTSEMYGLADISFVPN